MSLLVTWIMGLMSTDMMCLFIAQSKQYLMLWIQVNTHVDISLLAGKKGMALEKGYQKKIMKGKLSIREILKAFRERGRWTSFPGDSRMIRETSHVFEGHVSGSSSKTVGAENGVFSPRIKREKGKFHAYKTNICWPCCVAYRPGYFIKVSLTHEPRI